MAGRPGRALRTSGAVVDATDDVARIDVHPAWRFILYLMVAVDDPTLPTINATLALHGFAACTTACFERAFALVNPLPAEFLPYSRRHAETRAYLRKLRVQSLFTPEAHTEEMRDRLLGDPRLRARVETLLLGRVPAQQISKRLAKDGQPISYEAVEEFRHYFWNTEEMTLQDWVAYLARDGGGRTDLGGHRSVFTSALFCGPEVALHRAGLSRTVDIQESLERMASELDTTFREIQQLPLSPQKVEMLTTTVRTMLRVDERRQESDAALQDVLKRFERFRLRQDPAKLPTLGTLAPTGSIGDYSREEMKAARREEA